MNGMMNSTKMRGTPVAQLDFDGNEEELRQFFLRPKVEAEIHSWLESKYARDPNQLTLFDPDEYLTDWPFVASRFMRVD